MSGGSGSEPDRDDGVRRPLRAVAAQAAALAAAVHLLWAWPRIASPADARPYLFVAGSALAVAVAVATLRAGEYRRLYALGAGTLGAFLVGYPAWHGTGAGRALTTDPLAIAAVAVEVVGVAAYVGLYRLAPPTSVAVERRADGDERAGEGPRAEEGRP